MDLTKYRFRTGGFSQRFFSLPDRAHLPKPEALLAALLSRNGCSLDVLNIDCGEALRFLDLAAENELTGFILESIYTLKLENNFRSITIDHHGATVDLLTLLTRQSGLEAIKFEKFEKKFVNFLELTSQLNDRIVWLKGIVTSRTCYTSPEYRLSGDFDCFVKPTCFPRFFQLLREHDFKVIAGDSGFCNQLGVGPVNSIDSLFLVPSDEFVPSAVYGLYRNRWPLLDIKVNPLDRGLKMVELDRFEHNLVQVQWRGTKFSAPDLLDQLIIALTHFEKDRFIGWKQLLDIKLLAQRVNLTPELWDEFARRCAVEGVSTACSAGLSLAQERLELGNVEPIIKRLSPGRDGFFRRFCTFSVTPLFYWNTSSLLMLYVNAHVSDDSIRKKQVLRQSLLPDKNFLSRYYFAGQNLNYITLPLALLLHWITLWLPGGIVRRTYGKLIWRQDQYGATE